MTGRLTMRATTALLATTAGLTALAVALPNSSIASSGAHHAASAPAPGSVVPDKDPFYKAPENISTIKRGHIIGVRSIPDPKEEGVSADFKAWQISYRTNDSHNKAELDVTTLLVPTSKWTGKGARPIVSLQSPEDSVGTQCAPSYLIAKGSDSQDYALGGELLTAGWAVVLPDFEGPKSEFLAGPQAGHSVLDSIRAVKQFNRDGISKKNPWALDGYSGGAEATGWAVELQPSYYASLHLVGAAMGGTPADPAPVGEYIDGTAFAGFEFAAALGVDLAYPEAKINSILNAKGLAAFKELKGECEDTILEQYAFKKIADYSKVPNPFVVKSVAKVLKIDTMGFKTPKTPIYDYHANTDEIVPVAQDNTLVQRWCKAGVTVDKVRDPAGEHVEEAVARETSVQLWLKARFAGTKSADSC